jgi:protein-disulfide isomerase
MKAFLTAAAVAFALTLAPTAEADEVVATIDGKPLTMDELIAEVKPQLVELDSQRFEILDDGLSSMIAERLIGLEAEAKGVTVEQLEQTEIREKVAEPTEEQVAEVFEASKAQLGPDADLEALRPRIVDFLKSRGMGERAQEYLNELRAKYPVVVKLEAPKVDVEVGSHGPRGGKDAVVTIIGFSDYECPYCKRGDDTIREVLAKYGDKVRYYHRDFPLDFHANAHEAAQAARCAEDQDRFWDFHDALFAAAGAGGLSTERYGSIADELGLDRAAFDECLASGRHEDAVDEDTAAGAGIGVNGTPAFFINGRALPGGAQPLSKFEEVIDSELAKTAEAAEGDEG